MAIFLKIFRYVKSPDISPKVAEIPNIESNYPEVETLGHILYNTLHFKLKHTAAFVWARKVK